MTYINLKKFSAVPGPSETGNVVFDEEHFGFPSWLSYGHGKKWEHPGGSYRTPRTSPEPFKTIGNERFRGGLGGR